MPDSCPVERALAVLRTAADEAEATFTPREIRRIAGPGPDRLEPQVVEVQSSRCFGLAGLELVSGEEFRAVMTFVLPDTVHGVGVADDRLELGVNGLYPMEVLVDGISVFADDKPVVASGPALVDLVSDIRPGAPIEMEIRVHSPHHTLNADWCYFHVSTPGRRRRFLALDTIWAQLFLAHRLASDLSERDAVAAAVGVVPDRLPQTDEELATLADEVTSVLAPVAAQVRDVKVHAIGHSHIDLAWQWTWDDSRNVIERDIRSVLDVLDDYPFATFTHSQPASYEVIRTEHPDLWERLTSHVQTGRWEVATAQWVEGDVNLASGEAQCRQLLEGVTWTREHLGVSPKVFLAPDTFGHAGNLPQLAVSAGADVYYHHRGNPGERAGGERWPAYWWEGDDGSRILAVSTPVYLGPVTPGRVARDVVDAVATTPGLVDVLYFYGMGDHGGGPTRESLDALVAMRSSPGLPDIACSTLSAYADAVRASQPQLPVHVGESSTVFEGAYTTHADTKRMNRDGENALATADALAALAGHGPSPDLRDAWRIHLFHQFHDILAGTSIGAVYDDVADSHRDVMRSAGRATDASLTILHGHLSTDIAVTNQLGFARRDLVVVPGLAGTGAVRLFADDGVETIGQFADAGLVFVADLDGFSTVGYRLGDVVEQDELAAVVGDHVGAAHVAAPAFTVNTPHFDAMIRKDCGVVTRLLDKRTGIELVGHHSGRPVNLEPVRPELGMGVVQVLDEHPHHMSSWIHDDVHTETTHLRGAATRVVEHGPVRTVIEITQDVRSSTVTRRLSSYTELPRIDIDVDVAWNEIGSPDRGIPGLVMAFGSRQLDAAAWFETPYGAARRPADGRVVPALRWASVGGPDHGVAVLNDGKYGHDVLGTRMRVHLMRSAYEPDPKSDAGTRDSSRLAILPYVGDWRTAGVPQAGMSFNQPFLARLLSSPPRSEKPVGWRPAITSDTRSVVIAAAKPASDGDGRVLRIVETSGRAASVRLTGLEVTHADETTVTEEPIRGLPVTDGTVDIQLRPFQVLTLRVSGS